MPDYKNGYYSVSTGAYNPSATGYVCSSDFIPITFRDIIYFRYSSEFTIIDCYINTYDSTKTLLIGENAYNAIVTNKYYAFEKTAMNNAAYFTISIKVSQNNVNIAQVEHISILKTINATTFELFSNSAASNNFFILDWSNSIYNWGTGLFGSYTTRIGLRSVKKANHSISVKVKSGFKFAIFTFSSTTPAVETQIASTGWVTETHYVEEGTYFLINMAKTDDSNITPDDGQNLIIGDRDNTSNSTNFVVGTDLIKRNITPVLKGTLKYGQSFCIYDNKCYSTDGDNIAEQDANFNVLRDVTLAVGHGNSFQLGNNGTAYVSGWDDNKVYCVDLSSLTITRTITLPVTGYTTCAIDDINELCYIFQRSTYPNTETRYNFIVYDYANSQTISTKQTKPFGAMQACDLFDDKIIVLNGLGDSTCPNGYRVYDLSGNILSTFVLTDFENIEPEGVSINRQTYELCISFGNKNVYKLI